MQNFYLTDYLKQAGYDADIIDSLKYELDQRIYYYGAQFKNPKESCSVAKRLKSFCSVLKPRKYGAFEKREGAKRICANSYFGLNQALRNAGYSVSPQPWQLPESEAGPILYKLCRRVERALDSADFNVLVSADLVSAIRGLQNELKSFYSAKADALIVPFDIPVFERLAIKACKEAGRPSFVFLHGLPGRYNNIDDNRADYLAVWGDEIKANYIKAGVDGNKIFVSGHPGLSGALAPQPRFELRDPLVITKSMCGAQHSAETIISDRGNSVLYLMMVQRALQKCGVNTARFRPHPSESAEWYLKYLDANFYKADAAPLAASLNRAGVVIGPASTVLVESLLAGVNYTVFEPVSGGRCLLGYPTVSPFDGSDSRVPVAATEAGLERMLESAQKTDVSVLSGYIQPRFSLEFLKKLI